MKPFRLYAATAIIHKLFLSAKARVDNYVSIRRQKQMNIHFAHKLPAWSSNTMQCLNASAYLSYITTGSASKILSQQDFAI